ncbi:hypothetical protein QN277_028537 [Acacia crassicarpa]|uniref:Uncharacterized protein n=1 Tax=Acacia crassicarpa TaxID=499986 RepID=A0AAE1J3E7_9FABA|nr:hypothetical protein QN277_028537 [Acacia crassicarpa]
MLVAALTTSTKDGEDSGIDELEKLESNVKQMAQEVMERLSTLSKQLKSTLTSVLAAQRPLVLEFSDIGHPEAPNSGAFPVSASSPSSSGSNWNFGRLLLIWWI